MLQTIDQIIRTLNERIARFCGWLCFGLVLLTVQQVLARYLFSSSSVALQELEWHLFAAIFLLAASYTFQQDAHVRVDIFYSRLSRCGRAGINVFGMLFFFFPMVSITLYHGTNYMLDAMAFTNPRPVDFYSAAWFSKDSFLYDLVSPLEALLRKTVLIGETSPDPGGLEARWLTKALIPLGFLLLLLQGIVFFLQECRLAFSRENQTNKGTDR